MEKHGVHRIGHICVTKKESNVRRRPKKLAKENQDEVFSVINLLSSVAAEPEKQLQIISNARNTITEMHKRGVVPSAISQSLWNITIHLQRVMNENERLKQD